VNELEFTENDAPITQIRLDKVIDAAITLVQVVVRIELTLGDRLEIRPCPA
jgi:hypothetical protein